MEKRPFHALGLSAESLKAVEKMGFEEASPIQTAVIPVALTGRDIVGQSATGSGKTAAFMLPAIERTEARRRAVQVLVLCPTRELAVQVAEETARLAFFKTGLREAPIYGGQSYERQFRALAAGVQIVIGTPGRVIDHLERGTLKLDAVRVVVLDEADRMLDMGFREDIERILGATPPDRQTLFFSATMPRGIQELIRRHSREPEWIKIEPHAQNAPRVEQVYFEVDRRSKIEALTRLIDRHDFRYGIIFCSTKNRVDELDELLHARGYAVDRLHGDISQAQRDRVMAKFRERKFEFLIATDVAARGLDVDDLEAVFNFDLPNDAEDYTHRIGRTGRAGKTGQAFTFVSGPEVYRLQGMIRYAKLKIQRGTIPSLDEVEEARSNALFERIRATLEAKDFRPRDALVDRLLEEGYATTDICSALIHLLTAGETPPPGKAGTAGAAPAPGGSFPPVASTAPAPRPGPPRSAEPASDSEADEGDPEPAERRKQKYARPARTGRESGMTVLFLNVGRKQLITPADVVGKIAGVTRLPAGVVGAIDIHQRHTLVDVAAEHAPLVLQKLKGIKMKGVALDPVLAEPGVD
ncbi:MAG TPA: DEAD/DEAH box helicase [Opitutaceae bacterium]|nr:DEAD/DEAH box helicase [Opitutaceae bacterium]